MTELTVPAPVARRTVRIAVAVLATAAVLAAGTQSLDHHPTALAGTTTGGFHGGGGGSGGGGGASGSW